MKRQKIKTQYPNVLYYEHLTRKLKNGQADKYYSIRYKNNKRTVEEGLGWASEGWNAQKASRILAQIKENRKLGTKEQSLAEMRKAKAEEYTLAQQKDAQEKASNILLSDFFEQYYLPHAMRTKRTWLHDKRRFYKNIYPALGNKAMRSITHEDIQVALNTLVDNHAAASTVKHHKSILSQVFNLASITTLFDNYIFTGKNPASKIKTPPVKNERQRFLTADEAELLINASKELPCIDLHDCIVLSLNTGLRLGELQRLYWIDVDMTNEILTVRDEAHRKPGGKIPLNDSALHIFKTRQQNMNATDGQVFSSALGGNLRDTLSKSFRGLVDSLNLNAGLAPNDRIHRIVFHTLRHTFASWLAIGGTDIYKIKTLMRHKTISMTMRYAHLIPNATRDAVRNLKPPTGI